MCKTNLYEFKNNGKKYIMTDETKEVNGHIFHRIQAVRDTSEYYIYMEPGTIGGWIESEENLSQDGECWIADDAMVFDNSKVYGDAFIGGFVFIYDSAKVCGNAIATSCGDYSWVETGGDVEIIKKIG